MLKRRLQTPKQATGINLCALAISAPIQHQQQKTLCLTVLLHLEIALIKRKINPKGEENWQKEKI
jgi:hypothetical protein